MKFILLICFCVYFLTLNIDFSLAREYCVAPGYNNAAPCFAITKTDKTNVGKVCIRNNATNDHDQIFRIDLNDGLFISSADIWVGLGVAQSPKDAKGNPVYSRYPLHCNIGSGKLPNTCAVTNTLERVYSSSILANYPDRPCGAMLQFIVHVMVSTANTGYPNVATAAWAGNTKFPTPKQNNKTTNNARYGTFEIGCDHQC
jgi:hypothetical protein